MKALSIHPVYAMGIAAGIKTVEIRTWTTQYRGDIVICSTAKKIKDTIPSHALAVVTLKDIVPLKKRHLKAAMMDSSFDVYGQYAWILENHRLIKPIPIKGKLSLWNMDEPIEYVDFKSEEDEERFLEKYWDPITL